MYSQDKYCECQRLPPHVGDRVQRLVDRLGAASNGEFVPDRGERGFVNIAECQYLKFVGMASVSRDVSAADTAADDGDAPAAPLP